MKRILLWLLVPSIALGATVYNYYPPPNQTWTAATAALQIGSAASTGASTTLYNGSAGANAHQTRLNVDASGNFNIVPLNDTGTPTASNSLQLQRSGSAFTGFIYTDSGSSFSTSTGGLSYTGTQGTFSMSTNDIVWTATINSQPLIQVLDGGTTGALAGFQTTAGAASNVTGFFYCLGPLQTLGAGLTNGPTTGAYCQLSTGDTLFGDAGNAPLILGTNGVFAGQVFAADQGLAWGAPTGGDKGHGTINATGLFINGTAALTSAPAPQDVQIFSAAGTATWTKPSGSPLTTCVYLVGAAGGGGGGATDAVVGTSISGGGGGGAGGYTPSCMSTASLNATETVTVGTGGTGGTGGGAGGAVGGNGNAGTSTLFGTVTYIRAFAGGGGAGGQLAAANSGGGGGAGVFGTGGSSTNSSAGTGGSTGGLAGGSGSAGAGSSTDAGAGGGGGLQAGAGPPGGNSHLAGAGGGSGGGLNTTTAFGGGNGGGNTANTTNPVGGTVPGGTGASGTALAPYTAGNAGAGGGASAVGAGGPGGAGARGSGGGGGGCGVGAVGGAGGKGGDGYAVVITSF